MHKLLEIPIGQAKSLWRSCHKCDDDDEEYKEQRRSVLDGLFQKASVGGEANEISTRGPINMAYRPQI